MDSAVAYSHNEIDVAVVGKTGDPIVIAEVKAGTRQRSDDVATYLQVLRSYAGRSNASYMMLVTPVHVMIWRQGQPTDDPVATLDTPDILREYEVFGGTTVVSHLALEITTKQWLQDLILHWHSQHPPFEEQVGHIGMLHAMKDGDVITEVRL